MYFVHVYIYFFKKIQKKKIQKKKFQDFQIFPKKEKNFQKKKEKRKGLWTRGIEPLSHLKKNSLN